MKFMRQPAVCSVCDRWVASEHLGCLLTLFCGSTACGSRLMCLHIPYDTGIRLILCTSGKIAGPFAQMMTELLCNKEKAWDSRWSNNRSMMESVVKGWCHAFANGKSKDKLAPKFTASLLIVPSQRKGGGGFSFVPEQGIKGHLAHQLANVVAAPSEDNAWLVSCSAGMNRRGHGTLLRDNPGGFPLV